MQGEAYRPLTRGKGQGKIRQLWEPLGALKRVQQWAARAMQRDLDSHISNAAHGFRPGRSIVSACRMHAAHAPRALLSVDLQDFFSSVTAPMVSAALQGTAYAKLEHLFVLDGRLPQGAPTSPVLSNLVASALDTVLQQQIPGLTYTRYADDLAFTSTDLIDATVLSMVARVVEQHGFALRADKTEWSCTIGGAPNFRQQLILHGLVVAPDRVYLPRARRKLLLRSLRDAWLRNDQKQVHGILGFVHMVYGEVPPYFLQVDAESDEVL